MSSEQSFVQFIADQMENAGDITFKKMFGEYGIFCNGKIVALVCDNKLFVKSTEKGRSFIGDAVEAPPYPGAKMSFLIDDRFEDREWMGTLTKITYDELPEPAKKKRKSAAPEKRS